MPPPRSPSSCPGVWPGADVTLNVGGCLGYDSRSHFPGAAIQLHSFHDSGSPPALVLLQRLYAHVHGTPRHLPQQGGGWQRGGAPPGAAAGVQPTPRAPAAGMAHALHCWRAGLQPLLQACCCAACWCSRPSRAHPAALSQPSPSSTAPASFTCRSSGTLPPPAGCLSLRGGAARCAASRPPPPSTSSAWALRTGELGADACARADGGGEVCGAGRQLCHLAPGCTQCACRHPAALHACTSTMSAHCTPTPNRTVHPALKSPC